MLIESAEALARESRVPMVMPLHDGPDIDFVGRVVSCVPTPDSAGARYDIGIEFVDLTRRRAPGADGLHPVLIRSAASGRQGLRLGRVSLSCSRTRMTERRSGGSSVGTKAIVGLLTGLAVGAAINASAQSALLAAGAAMEVVGTLWINAILMTILPLVVAKLVVSVAGQDDQGTVGRAGWRAFALFVGLLVVAAALTAAVMPAVFARLPDRSRGGGIAARGGPGRRQGAGAADGRPGRAGPRAHQRRSRGSRRRDRAAARVLGRVCPRCQSNPGVSARPAPHRVPRGRRGGHGPAALDRLALALRRLRARRRPGHARGRRHRRGAGVLHRRVVGGARAVHRRAVPRRVAGRRRVAHWRSDGRRPRPRSSRSAPTRRWPRCPR